MRHPSSAIGSPSSPARVDGTSARRRCIASLLGGVGVATLLLATRPLLAAPPSPSIPSAASGAADVPKTVTLITGDRVVVRGKNLESLGIVRAPGREKIRFTTRRLPDVSGRTRHLFVIPDDAMALLGRDRVDLRLCREPGGREL